MIRAHRIGPFRGAVLAGTLAVSACGPLVQIGGNDKAPPMLLTLTAIESMPRTPVAATATNTVLVLTPATLGPLQTLRLPVTMSATEIRYLTGAVWAEQPNRLFRRVLADTLSAKGVVVVDPRGPAPLAARTLSGVLIDFGLDVSDPAAPHVHVRYDARLSKPGATLAVERFEVSLPVSDQSPGAVAIALNAAANTVARDVALWVAK
jgi:cholesterol transport system auxiliary component